MAFIDILAPPYNPKEGRDCNYYEKLVSDFFCLSSSRKDHEATLLL